MTDTTGFTFDHIFHGRFADNRLVGKGLGMAIFAAVCLDMECVAESGWRYPFQVEGYFLGLEPLVAAITVGRYPKSAFSIVARAAGATLFHFGHGHRFFLAGYDDAVVTPFAGAAGF